MAYLSVGNEAFSAFIFDDTKLNFQLVVDGRPDGNYLARKNRLVEWGGKHAPDKPYNGVLYYALPCVFESLRLQRLEDGEVLYDAIDGELPEGVEQADLTKVPAVRVLEERIIQRPWRLDRRYTPVDRYLVFDCEQVYRRRHPSRRKVWERVQAELRQVVDVIRFAHDDEWTDRSVIRHRFA